MENLMEEKIFVLGFEWCIGLLNAVNGKDILSRGNNMSDDNANEKVLSAYKL